LIVDRIVAVAGDGVAVLAAVMFVGMAVCAVAVRLVMRKKRIAMDEASVLICIKIPDDTLFTGNGIEKCGPCWLMDLSGSSWNQLPILTCPVLSCVLPGCRRCCWLFLALKIGKCEAEIGIAPNLE
jgi:hypothetical protein